MDLPHVFLHNMAAVLGRPETARLAQIISGGDRVTSIRLNSAKKAHLTEKCTGIIPVPWCNDGYYLDQRPSFTFDPLLHAGLYYVQEASSMFLQKALRTYVKQPVKMLDLCAAPGGKSTLAVQTLPEGSLLVSNEIDRQRAQILCENIVKWGMPSCIVTNNAPSDFAPLCNYFDVILTDVPCSGEGMFRKDPKAVEEWSDRNVSVCANRQRQILEDCWDCLKPGGLLIYSTCTYNVHEDEENVHWIIEQLGAESLPVDCDDEWGITGNLLSYNEYVYHFFPHKTEGEGFFLAVLRKSGIDTNRTKKATKKEKKGRQTVISKVSAEIRNWLVNPDAFVFSENGELLTAVPRLYETDFKELEKGLHSLNSGITVARKKGHDWIPAHNLAMSICLNREAFRYCDLTLEQAWTYLRGESVVLPSDVKKGFVLLTYKNHPLGFVKNIGTRSNNLYPRNWKIRSSYFPSPEEAFSTVL